ncbi:MAG: helix-turn-helix domain-containing protein [Oscillospiraceae bacterium]|nr:helix-turn-helix domain-containing protein [Oscillospiraceae bacterium]
MKLSMWTICAHLESRGLAVTPSIDQGLPRITAFRQSDASSYSARYVEIVPSAPADGETPGVTLVNDMDYIIVRGADSVQVANYLSEIFEFYVQWENRLYAGMLESASLQSLLDIANAAFNRPMFIKNDSSWILAITRGYPADTHPSWARMERSVGKHTLDFDAVRTVSTDPEFQNVFMERYPCVARSPAYRAMILHANIFSGNRRVAEIIALENGVPFNRGEVHLMHEFAALVEKYLRGNSEMLFSVSDPATFLIALLEGRDADERNFTMLFRSAGIGQDDALCVVVIEGKNRSDNPMLAVLRDELETQVQHTLVFSYRGQVVCLLGLGAYRSYAAAMQLLRTQVPQDAFLWGASYEFDTPQQLPAYYRQACAALEKAAQRGGASASIYEVASQCIAERCAADEETRRLIHPDLLRLQEADREERTQYSRTLFEYLLCGGNYTDAATRMGLHRNSLIYRMNKIRAIMHTNPDDHANRELLLLSYMLSGQI